MRLSCHAAASGRIETPGPAMLSLESIRIFLRLADTGSFSAAGRSLPLSRSVISDRIQTLEEHLGCLLLTRTTRRMSPTEAGRVFYDRCLDVAASVERAETSVETQGAAPRGTLKVTAPSSLGRRVVAPLIPAFRTRHAEADVHLRLSDHLLTSWGRRWTWRCASRRCAADSAAIR